MAVVFMKKLEEEPESYDLGFSRLTAGINQEVNRLILEKIKPGDRIIEAGCGTGKLAIQMAKKGGKVLAMDQNPKMIQFARQQLASAITPHLTANISFMHGSATTLDPTMDILVRPSHVMASPLRFAVSDNKHSPASSLPTKNAQSSTTWEELDAVVSTFMLSELRPLEQQIFLRTAWKKLRVSGTLIIAAEFEPKGWAKIPFFLQRRWYLARLHRQKAPTIPLKYFMQYPRAIGFRLVEEKSWRMGSIRLLIFEKIGNEKNKPGYYQPSPKKHIGIGSIFRRLRCVMLGQVDAVPIEPGLYISGSPSPTSPVFLTANYDLTYIKFMQDLRGLDAWVICVDSHGINVWCAARGGNFGNSQVLEAIEASGIRYRLDHTQIILPQLAAGGVALPEMPKKSKEFPFTFTFGPIWSHYIPEYLGNGQAKKSPSMTRANFNLYHRTRATFTHTTFLLRKIFLLPCILLGLALTLVNHELNASYPFEILIMLILGNFLVGFGYPIGTFTRKFILKGWLFSAVAMPIFYAILAVAHRSWLYPLWLLPFGFWLVFFSTMSFSGYTFDTGIQEIGAEYPQFQKNQVGLFIGGVLAGLSGLIYYAFI